MTTYYVDSAGSNTAPYDTWAKAATQLSTTTALSVAGDTIYVASTHSEAITGASTFRPSSASPGNPVKILCVTVATPPTTLNTGAVCQCTTSMNIDGDMYVYGIKFSHGSSGTATGTIAGANGRLVLDTCEINCNAGGLSSLWRIGSASSASVRQNVTFKNCTFTFTAAGQRIVFDRSFARFIGGSAAATGTAPTTLIDLTTTSTGHMNASFEAFTFGQASNTIFGAPSTTAEINLINCKYNSAATLVGAYTSSIPSLRLTLLNTDSGNTNYRYALRDYPGSIDHDLTQYITGFTGDGVTAYSVKMTGNANTNFYHPLYTEWNEIWNDTTASTLTVTVEVLYDGAADLNDNEVWLETETLEDASFPLTTVRTDMCGLIATPAAQAAGTGAGSWTKGAPATGWRSQKLNLTTGTIQKKGFIRWRVGLGANKVVYFHPKPTVA